MTRVSTRTGAAEGHNGYYHEAAFYGSDDEFLAIVVPFLLDGRAAGEPTISTLGERNAALVRAAIGDTTGITFVEGSLQYARPAVTIADYRARFGALVEEGATQIRVVGDVPHPGFGVPWDAWARYEAVVNHAYDDFPLWGLCPYDTRITPDDVLEEVARTHPRVVGPDGHHVHNDRFEDPSAFLSDRLRKGAARPDPLEAAPPAVRLAEPSPAEARHAVARLATLAGVPDQSTQDLVLAVSEVVTNACVHGRPPVPVEAWAGRNRIVVAVRDGGAGPVDPFVGLLCPDREPGRGGFGLWLAHQLCADVRLGLDEHGCFVVRLVSGVADGAPLNDAPAGR
jgi:anti-sigma regulatory factor (Ser/Thr protein kinase)